MDKIFEIFKDFKEGLEDLDADVYAYLKEMYNREDMSYDNPHYEQEIKDYEKAKKDPLMKIFGQNMPKPKFYKKYKYLNLNNFFQKR